ncbi:DUF6659 family protein [Nitrosopumilus sp.]|uniref:DUF6659 family protein n=1 Tax=Nitrosopumilus sp. TaxID=2024843 RepID=UPI003B59A1EB
MDFENFYNKIMNIDKSVQYAAILHKNGEKMFGGYRAEMEPVLTDDELKMVHFYAVQRWDTRKNIEHRIGKTKYSMGEYEKMKRISFPINDKYLLMVHTSIENDHQNIISEILNLIKNIHDNDS